MVSQHQSSSFNAEISSLRIFEDTSRQTSSTTSFTGCVDSSWQELSDIFQELAFCSGWVSYNADIDISSQFDTFFCFFLDTAKKLKKNSFFNIKLARSIAPSIHGHLDVKKGVLL
jgi:hypothetical protein